MGTWSSSLYGNDSTCDVRDIYMGFLQEQMGNQEAYDKTLESFEETIRGDEEPLFWFALADTQWKIGRLMPEVKSKALEWIEQGGGLELWENGKSGCTGWKKTLEQLKSKIETPMPSEKKIRKPHKVDMNLWAIGDVYAYRFRGESAKERGLYGRYILIKKVGEWDDFGIMRMRIQVLDKIFDAIPEIDVVKGLRAVPLNCPLNNVINSSLNCLMWLPKKSLYPADSLVYIGNERYPEYKISPVELRGYNSGMGWNEVDDAFSEYYSFWQGKEYRIVGNEAFMI